VLAGELPPRALRLSSAEPQTDHVVHVRAEDGTAADVDLGYLLDYGGVFEPLRDPLTSVGYAPTGTPGRSCGLTTPTSRRKRCTATPSSRPQHSRRRPPPRSSLPTTARSQQGRSPRTRCPVRSPIQANARAARVRRNTSPMRACPLCDRDDAPVGRSAWFKSLRDQRSWLACRSDGIACNELASADGQRGSSFAHCRADVEDEKAVHVRTRSRLGASAPRRCRAGRSWARRSSRIIGTSPARSRATRRFADGSDRSASCVTASLTARCSSSGVALCLPQERVDHLRGEDLDQ
jgi:hypothetical protein